MAHTRAPDYDEVGEGAEGECGSDADGARTGMAARDDAHDAVADDEEEDGCKEGEVPLPGVAQDGLAHVIANELDDVLHAVHKNALRNQAARLPLLEHEDTGEQERQRNAHPEDVVGEANGRVTHDGMGHKALEQLVHLP